MRSSALPQVPCLNFCFGRNTGPSAPAQGMSGNRPIEASKARVRYVRFTSTPAARRRFSPPADPRDLADPVAFALWFEGHRRFHNSEDGVRASLKARQSRRQDAESSSQRGCDAQGGSGRWRRLCSRGSSMPTGRNHGFTDNPDDCGLSLVGQS